MVSGPGDRIVRLNGGARTFYPAPPIKAAMRLTLVISSLRAGGAERVMAVMADHWAGQGHVVTLLTFTAPDEPPFFRVDQRVRLVALDLNRHAPNIVAGVLANLRRARILRRAIRSSRPDVVLAFMDRTNVLTLLATIGLRVPVVVEEHNDPAEEILDRRWRLLRDTTYRRAARVVALSQAAMSYFGPAIRRHGRVIPNPVVRPDGATETDGTSAVHRPSVVAIGRLVPQKGFDLLLDAFALLGPAERGLTLEIWGEGRSRRDLEAHRDRLGLASIVTLPGSTPTPGTVMRRASCFVLSSRYEGFPTVLGEAMALGLPVVAFDCPSGPREMIRDGVDGLLVPPGDINALARAIDRVLGDDALRATLADRAPEILDRFSLDRVMAMWDALLAETVSREPA